MPAVKTKKVTHAKLKALRAQYGLSQVDMARILGICEVSYLSKENGKREFKVSEARIISKYFKIPAEEIFFE